MALSTLRRIHQFVDNNFSISVVCGFELSNSVGFDTIVAGTCLLMPVASKVWASVQGGPSTVIDPDHVLWDLLKMSKYLFMEDNMVSYCPILWKGEFSYCISL